MQIYFVAAAQFASPRGALRLRGGARGLGEYGIVEPGAAVDMLISCHLAPTKRLFELVDRDGDGILSSAKVQAAAAELEKRRQALASMTLVNKTFEYRCLLHALT